MFGTKNIHAHVSLLCMLAHTTFDLKNLLLKGQCTQNLKKKSLSSCTHSAEHKWRYRRMSVIKQLHPIDFYKISMEVNGSPKPNQSQSDYKHSSKYLPLCSA